MLHCVALPYYGNKMCFNEGICDDDAIFCSVTENFVQSQCLKMFRIYGHN